MSNQSEKLAGDIRSALGSLNNDAKPVVALVRQLVDRVEKAEAVPMPRWVKCSERLPTEADTDDDGKIWVYSEESDRKQKVFRLTPETLIIHYRAGNCVPVTHWHHIPKRPQPPQDGE